MTYNAVLFDGPEGPMSEHFLCYFGNAAELKVEGILKGRVLIEYLRGTVLQILQEGFARDERLIT